MATTASPVGIKDLLSASRTGVEGGLHQYTDCFKLNMGTGPGKLTIPRKTLARLEIHLLPGMNICDHDHQRRIMHATRQSLAEEPASAAEGVLRTSLFDTTSSVGSLKSTDMDDDGSLDADTGTSSKSTTKRRAKQRARRGSVQGSTAESKKAMKKALNKVLAMQAMGGGGGGAKKAANLRRRSVALPELKKSPGSAGSETRAHAHHAHGSSDGPVSKSKLYGQGATHMASVEKSLISLTKSVAAQFKSHVNCEAVHFLFCDFGHDRFVKVSEGKSLEYIDGLNAGGLEEQVLALMVPLLWTASEDSVLPNPRLLEAGVSAESVLALPLMSRREARPIAIAQLVNRSSPLGETATGFTEADEQMVQITGLKSAEGLEAKFQEFNEAIEDWEGHQV